MILSSGSPLNCALIATLSQRHDSKNKSRLSTAAAGPPNSQRARKAYTSSPKPMIGYTQEDSIVCSPWSSSGRTGVLEAHRVARIVNARGCSALLRRLHMVQCCSMAASRFGNSFMSLIFDTYFYHPEPSPYGPPAAIDIFSSDNEIFISSFPLNKFAKIIQKRVFADLLPEVAYGSYFCVKARMRLQTKSAYPYLS